MIDHLESGALGQPCEFILRKVVDITYAAAAPPPVDEVVPGFHRRSRQADGLPGNDSLVGIVEGQEVPYG